MKHLATIAVWLLLFAPARAQWVDPSPSVDGWVPAEPQPRRDADPRFAAVCRVRAPSRNGYSAGTGTLIAVNDTVGWVLTANHVIDGSQGEPNVTFQNGFVSGSPIVARSPRVDLALLRCWKPKDVTPVSLAAALPQRGDALTIAGFGGGGFRASTGYFSTFRGNGRERCWLEVDRAQARSGDSGGPIFDVAGNLAGCLWGASPGETVGSHIQTVREFLPAECRPFLGGGGCRPSPPIVPSPVPNPGPSICPTPAPTPDAIAGLNDQLARIADRLDQLERRPPAQGPAGPPGPPGEPGKNGQDGQDGKPGAAVDVDALADRLEARLKGKLRVVVEPMRP